MTDFSGPGPTGARSTPVFVYGSLMVPEVLTALLDRAVPTIPGRIDGWRRCELEGLPYPAIVSDEQASVAGLLLTDLEPHERDLFDTFEGPEYDIVEVQATTAHGPLEAEAYAAGDRLTSIAAATDWDPRLLDIVLDAYVESCRRFRQAFDAERA